MGRDPAACVGRGGAKQPGSPSACREWGDFLVAGQQPGGVQGPESQVTHFPVGLPGVGTPCEILLPER